MTCLQEACMDHKCGWRQQITAFRSCSHQRERSKWDKGSPGNVGLMFRGFCDWQGWWAGSEDAVWEAVDIRPRPIIENRPRIISHIEVKNLLAFTTRLRCILIEEGQEAPHFLSAINVNTSRCPRTNRLAGVVTAAVVSDASRAITLN